MNKVEILKKVQAKLKSIDFSEKSFLKSKPEKLKPKERKELNRDFEKEGLDGNGRFKKIDHGIQKISEILMDHDFELSTIPTGDIFKGDSGRKELKFSRKTRDPHDPIDIVNSIIVFSWHVLHKKKITDVVNEETIEILAYVS